jgi:signal transduction histidine kinase/DNA-binding response OmpR family regulator
MAVPMSAESGTERRAHDPPGGSIDEKANILIVDDLPEKLLVFGTVLEDLGQNLVFVKSGNEALREVLQREFAVILLDVNMPGIDGFETAGLIRRYKRSAHTPIIFITAYADELQTARGYSLGAVDYILSPVVPEVLRSKVKVFVELHTMQRHVRRQAEERVALAAAEAARRTAEENDRRSNFLSNASRVLSGSLDTTVGMHRLVELVVPELATLAVLVLVDEARALDRALVAFAPRGKPPVVQVDSSFAKLPTPVQLALQQTLEVNRRLALSKMVLPSLNADSFGLGGRLELRSAAVVPLVIAERALGVLLVGTDGANAGSRDWPALEELASRAAVAFENSQLYSTLQVEIAERLAAQTELQESNRRKDQFLAMLSHELRNPLAPIRNALELIRRIGPPDPKFQWAGDVMDRQLLHLTRLVEELLDVARISQGKITLNKETVDLKAVIAQSIEIAQPFIDAGRHTLNVKAPEQPVWLHGDMSRLSQVVANLLHNAAKYSDDGSTIHLSLHIDNGEAVITVRDKGIGIDAPLLTRIFDLFEQGERSLARSEGGLGVGLTLVRRLVELHGGHVDAFSEGPEKGAEFRVALPCISVVQADEPTQPDEPVSPPVARGSRVLIVDDNADAAESIALYLKLEGHEVKTVSDGQQALASGPVFAPQVIVLDIGLPGLSGYDVASRMRQMPATQEALMIALTGYGAKEDRTRALDAGFDHHCVKPTDPHKIVELIAHWQEASRAGEHGAPPASATAKT